MDGHPDGLGVSLCRLSRDSPMPDETTWSTERVAELRQDIIDRTDVYFGQFTSQSSTILSLLDTLESAREERDAMQRRAEAAEEEMAGLEADVRERDELIVHMWNHDGCSENGFWQMATEQKALYSLITGRNPEAP